MLLFRFDLIYITKHCNVCPKFTLSPPLFLLVVVTPACVVSIMKSPTFAEIVPTSDDIQIDLVLPDMDTLGLSCCGSTAGRLRATYGFFVLHILL